MKPEPETFHRRPAGKETLLPLRRRGATTGHLGEVSLRKTAPPEGAMEVRTLPSPLRVV